MNRGVNLQSSPVQQMMAGNPNWWNINSMRPPTQPSVTSPFLPPPPPPPSFFIPQFVPNTSSSPSTTSSGLPFPSWHIDDNIQELPESWSQLLLGGLVGEDEKGALMRQFHQAKNKLENWEEQILSSTQAPNAPAADVKQESSGCGSFVYGHQQGVNDHQHHQDFQSAALSSLSQIMQSTASASSSPKSSCVTSFNTSMLDFSSKSDVRHPPPHRSSDQCNSTANGGGPLKRARVQPSSTPTFKVRKEKLGDRITALHQLVSPFGKTDTASVLLEAIATYKLTYSFLPSQSNTSISSSLFSHVHGERNCVFPEDPGQLLNDNCMKRKGAPEQDADEEAKKDLRSRGLCLVPVSCTLQVGSDNGADYWAPALGGGFQ
ncbi:transcription factor bHLH68-like [Prunus avium]|uniref:Transcription factor bHLH68-like n=1 Tax=Prunus avium TaxID=42229 RepID=A0A6P5S0X3_PRUAV|nr:transcription factor bHLH68-like [Prunus avium]